MSEPRACDLCDMRLVPRWMQYRQGRLICEECFDKLPL